MSRYITAVRLEGGSEHKHIVGCHILDRDSDPNVSGAKKASWVIEQIDAGNKYITRDWQGNVATVKVVTEGKTRYIRTEADEKMTDNLLRLPRYL
jgi:hypothetical protein